MNRSKASAKHERSKSFYWEAIALLIGTIIGAGVLGIPYVISQSGILIGAIHLFVIGFAILYINLFLGEIALRTKGKHQLSGYIEKYLGKWGKALITFSMVVGIYGALIAYLIGEGEIISTITKSFVTFLSNYIPQLANLIPLLTPQVCAAIFFIVCSIIIMLGLKATGKTELIIASIMIVIVFLITIFSFDKISLSNYYPIANLKYAFLPFGVILFAFVGAAAIPSMAGLMHKEKKKLKKAIIIGTIIPFAVYLIFSLVTMGMISNQTFNSLDTNQRIATIALSLVSSNLLGLFANIFAALSMFTSFLALAIALVWMYHYDFKINKPISIALTLLVPIIIWILLLIIKKTSFIEVLGITGSFAGGIEGILIVLAFFKSQKKSERKPEFQIKNPHFIGIFIILIFILGILYKIWELTR